VTGHRLTPLARTNRKVATPAEAKMWSLLRNRQIENCKFRRQHPIGNYIADFCCEDLSLIIELDGSQHAAAEVQDAKRTMELENMKFLVLRFWNNQILQEIDGVIDAVVETIHIARATRH
jgi:adenine-specific DNA-methyltransferase